MDSVSQGFCPHCGRPADALTGLGTVAMLDAYDVPNLCALFAGEYDDQPCPDCRQPLGVSATVVFVDLEDLCAWWVLGSRMRSDSSDELWQQLRHSSHQVEPPLRVAQCANLGVLRDELRQRLKMRIEKVRTLSVSGSPSEPALAELDSRVFGAIEVGRLIPGSGLGLKALDGRDLYLELARIQAECWVALCRRWLNPVPDGAQLGRELDGHFSPDAVLPGAPAAALAELDRRMRGKTLSPLGEYIIEAVRAAIHAVAGTPNPSGKLWASLHFGLQMQRHLGSDEGRRTADIRAVSPHQAAATITFQHAWDASAEQLANAGADRKRALDALRHITGEAGHPTLIDQLMLHGLRIEVPDLTPSKLVEMARTMHHAAIAGGGDAVFIGFVQALGQDWTRDGCVDKVEQTLELILPDATADAPLRADLLAWLGECCKNARQPQHFLDRVGDVVQPWEEALPDEDAVALWNERSNALRLAGRYGAARSINERILGLVPKMSPGAQRTARHNHAILLRETGDVERSAAGFEQLLEYTHGLERIGLLEPLAMACQLLGRHGEQRRCLEEVLKLASGPRADHAERARAQLALERVISGQHGDAVKLLLQLDALESVDPFVLLPVASAWATLLANDATLSDEALDAIDRCYRRLGKLVVAADKGGDVQGVLDASRLRAVLEDLAGSNEADAAWEFVRLACARFQQPLGMVEILALAANAYEDGNADAGRGFLLQLPAALASRTAQVRDIPAVSMTLEHALTVWLDRLTEAVLEQRAFEDIRLIAEMRREVVARAQRRARAVPDSKPDLLMQGLGTALLARLAPASGQLVVHEWIETASAYASFVTVIDSGGGVASHWLPATGIDLAALERKMRVRLRDWTPGRPGDPFDWPAWRSLEAWVKAAIGEYAGADAHVIFVELDDFAGLPWHVAVADRWSASYASGWEMLLTLVDRSPADAGNLGLAMVPRYRESVEVTRALNDGAQQVRELSAAHGERLVDVHGSGCDRDALAALLSKVRGAVLLCHGFVALESHEVALMVAHAGALPPAHSVAVGAEGARAHRFGWRECAELQRAPDYVYAAACSSNLSHIVGLGERAGLFAGLRRAGTRCLVAPRWDVVAAVFIPILMDVLRRHHFGGEPLADAVRQACRQAENMHARWMSWALSIEGDWR